MIDIDVLNDKYGVEGEIGFAELDGGLPFIMVANKFADVNICLYGAHITGYRPSRSMEVLWMSSESLFEPGKAIRGGIPVCFPWFGPHESDNNLPQHGFARLMSWDVEEIDKLPGGENRVVLKLCSSEETKKLWDHDFCAEMIIVIGEKLSVGLKITNTSDKSFEYTCALHSYFSVSAIDNIVIEGLKNTWYNNQLDGNDYVQEEDLLPIEKAETRHYYDTGSDTLVYDPVFARRIRIEKRGSKNTTVWNPWEETSKQMADMPDDAYQTFICVETVNKINNRIALSPGETHETRAIIGLL